MKTFNCIAYIIFQKVVQKELKIVQINVELEYRIYN